MIFLKQTCHRNSGNEKRLIEVISSSASLTTSSSSSPPRRIMSHSTSPFLLIRKKPGATLLLMLQQQQHQEQEQQKNCFFSTSRQNQQQQQQRASSGGSASSADMMAQLRNSMVKPFMLQCHPDVHLMTTAKKVNLRAIQNLNAYMDTLQSIALGKFTAMKPHDSRLVEIDFILKLEGQHRHSKRNSKSKKDAGSSSRRKVELLLPPFQLCRELASGGSIQNSSLRQRLHEHSRRELVKLLRMAGLNIPPDHSMNAVEAGHPYSWDTALGFAFRDDYRSSEAFYSPPDETDDHDGGFRRAHFDHRSRPKTAYETSRDRFTTNIQWHNYDKLYAQAVAEMNADAATEGLVQKHAGRRRAMIAGILANARILQQQQQSPPTFDQDGSSSSSSGISFVEQLVAFRRLSLLLDQNFEALQMEEFGAMWESCRIVLTESRPFNVSSSALHKKRARNAATGSGFSFTLHPDMSVTIHVPIDFRDEELIQELDRNVWDFYNFIDDGMDELLPDQGS